MEKNTWDRKIKKEGVSIGNWIPRGDIVLLWIPDNSLMSDLQYTVSHFERLQKNIPLTLRE